MEKNRSTALDPLNGTTKSDQIKLLWSLKGVRDRLAASGSELAEELGEALIALGHEWPETPQEAPSPSLFSQNLASYPVAALLASLPDRIAGLDAYRFLCDQVLAISFILRGGGQEQNSPIKNACDTLRVAYVKEPFSLADMPVLPADSIRTRGMLQVWCAGDDAIRLRPSLVKRLDKVRILFDVHVTNRGDWKRNRSKHRKAEPEIPRAILEVVETELLEDEGLAIDVVRDVVTAYESEGRVSFAEQRDDQLSSMVALQVRVLNERRGNETSTALVTASDRGATHAIIRRKLGLPCNSGVLAEAHAADFYEVCLTALRKLDGIPVADLSDKRILQFERALFSALSLVTGRSMERLYSLPHLQEGEKRRGDEASEYWRSEDRRYHLVHVPQISRSAIALDDLGGQQGKVGIDLSGVLEVVETSPVQLDLPDDLCLFLSKYLDGIRPNLQHHLGISRGNKVPLPPEGFAHAFSDLGVRASQLSQYLAVQAAKLGIDSAVIGFMTGAQSHQVPALHYTGVRQSVISAAHNMVLKTIGAAVPENKKIAERTVGSALVPKKSTVRNIFAGQRRYLQQLKKPSDLQEWAQLHHWKALYTFQVLSLGTGLRGVGAPFEYLSDFDRRRGLLLVKDKEQGSRPPFRIIPLCRTACAQLDRYLDHLLELRQAAEFLAPEVVNHIDRVFESDEHLLFDLTAASRNERSHWVMNSLRPNSILRELLLINPLPLNWPRHFLRTHLSGRCSGELIDAFEGHAQMGRQVNSVLSGASVADLFQVSDAIEKLMEEMEIAPL